MASALSPLSFPFASWHNGSSAWIVKVGSIGVIIGIVALLLLSLVGCCMLPLLPYHLSPPSHHLVAPAGCCMLHCIRHTLVLRHPLVLSLHQLVVACVCRGLVCSLLWLLSTPFWTATLWALRNTYYLNNTMHIFGFTTRTRESSYTPSFVSFQS